MPPSIRLLKLKTQLFKLLKMQRKLYNKKLHKLLIKLNKSRMLLLKKLFKLKMPLLKLPRMQRK